MSLDRRYLLRLATLIAMGVLLAVPVFAQTKPAATAKPAVAAPGASLTGSIAGKVLNGKEGVAYANVLVLGTKIGAQTDETGSFVIRLVPVGSQQVKVQALGFEAIVKTVQVNAGLSADVEFVVGEFRPVKQVDEIVVTAEKRIDTKSSTTKQSITAEKLREIPVDNLSQAIATKAGIVAKDGVLHFRGGRGGEVKFQFDGVEVSDPLFGQNANVAGLAVAGTDIITGGLDAEYGGALSGVVSVTTKEGTNRLGGEVRWDTDRYGDPTKTFDSYDRFTFGFGGPTPVKDLTYFATYEGTFSDTYLRSSMTKPHRTLLDFIQVGNRQANDINTNFKLAYRMSPKHKLTFETVHNHTINTPYNHMWSRKGFVQVTFDTIRTPNQPDRYNPRYGTWSPFQVDTSYLAENLSDHVPTIDQRFTQYTSVWTNSISDKSVMTTRLSTFAFETRQSVGRKQPWEYEIQSPFYWSGNIQFGTENNPYYATHGDFPAYSLVSSQTSTLKSDFSTGHWKQHTFKTGLEARYNRVQNLNLVLPNNETNGLPGGTRSDFVNYNPEGAAYVQDKWEYEGLVLNAGVRYDLFTPGLQIQDIDLKSGQRYKKQFSPRIGIAYPISDKDQLSFHYSWTYQTPQRNFIFQNREVNTNVAVRGNPDLQPETNIAYQAGVQHIFSRDLSGQFFVFFKDIYGLISVRQERDQVGNLINVYYNGDYASARGFEASITKSFSHKFSAEANYTYQLATGVASDPNSALQFFNGGKLYLPIAEQPLDWDQRHTFTLTSNVRDPGKWGFRMLWSYGSGFPFTPAFRNDRRADPLLDNSRRLPSISRLTVDGDKFYKIWGQNVTVWLDARNVLNAKNVQNPAANGLGFPNPYINTAGNDYLIYYTETGRAGGAFLQDTNGDNLLDWVPVSDPRVFEEGRNVRLGLSVTF